MNPLLFLLMSCSGRWVFDLDHDEDNDGFTTKEGDCADNPNVTLNDNQENPIPSDEINSGATEIRYNGIDDNCNGMDDEDADGDNFSVLDGDCDDNNAAIFPGGIEFRDGLKNDCTADTYVDGINYLRNLVTFGGQSGDHAGWRLAGGDLNGDGNSDIVAGGNRASGEAGISYSAFGHEGTWEAENSFADANVSVTGDSENDQSGSSETVCDLDGDGFADWAIGSIGDDSGATNGGGVALFLGSTDFNGSFSFGSANSLWWNSQLNANAGTSLACGDVNTQDSATLLVGAPGLNGAQGAVYAVSKNTSGDLDTSASSVLYGKADGDHFGSAIAASGDVNGDGLDDLLVGTPGDSSNGSSVGSASLFLGGETISSNPFAVYQGTDAYDQAGTSIAILPDMDGDGYDETVVAAPFHDGSGQDSGAVYVNRGGFGLSDKELRNSDMIINGSEAGGEFGLSVTSVGDFDADGLGDLAVGSLSDANGEDAGIAYLYLGKNLATASSLDTSSADAAFVGDAGSHAFALAGVGNVNGQVYEQVGPYDDLAIGAPDALDGSGQLFAIFGQASEE